MSRLFEQLAVEETEMGVLTLRRRLEPILQVDVWEVILGDEHLMSSIFTTAEVALGELGVAAVEGDDLDVVVGGLGLGYTAAAVLDDRRVRRLWVVEALAPVIDWHRRGLLPLSPELAGDRCELVEGDFFAMVRDRFPVDLPESFDAVVLDIDHTPQHHLHPSHASFYTEDGLNELAGHLRPGGVFALWSDDPPDDTFVTTLQTVFAEAESHWVTFPNHHTGGEAGNTVYLARRGDRPSP